ncbi:MAG: hypothetical protein V3V96_10650 [Acidiferrobacterales bacterium]
MKEVLESRAGVTTLSRMVGVEALADGMESENRMVDEHSKALHKDLWGGEAGQEPESEPMRIMAARDVYVNPPPPVKPPLAPRTKPPPSTKPPPLPVQSVQPAPAPQPNPPKTASTLTRAAFVAALLGIGAGGGVIIPWTLGAFNRGPPAAERPVDHDTITQIELE